MAQNAIPPKALNHRGTEDTEKKKTSVPLCLCGEMVLEGPDRGPLPIVYFLNHLNEPWTVVMVVDVFWSHTGFVATTG